MMIQSESKIWEVFNQPVFDITKSSREKVLWSLLLDVIDFGKYILELIAPQILSAENGG
jgi:hypothetical protein